MRPTLATLLIAGILTGTPVRARLDSVCGDADGSGDVTVSDGVNALRAAADLSTRCTLETCDVDRDGRITVTDGVNILRRAAGLPTNDDCGEPSPSPTATSTPAPEPTFTPSADPCCVHCGDSLPCGDECIPFIFICREPVGCACF